MANKEFKIQSGTVSLNGVDLSASADGKVVLPGVTRSTGYIVEEVRDIGDQTHQFVNQYTAIVIDYSRWMGNQNAATFSVTFDDQGYIDEIQVTNPGTYTVDQYNTSYSFSMYGYDGTEADPFANFNEADWYSIPFIPTFKASGIESDLGGGNGLGDLYAEGTTLKGAGNSSVSVYGGGSTGKFTTMYAGTSADIDLYAVNDNGQQEAWAELYLNASNHATPQADVIVNGSSNTYPKIWSFKSSGEISFPDGSIQSTAYTGGGNGGGSTTDLVGDGYTSSTGIKRTIHRSFQGYQGGESTSIYVTVDDGSGISVGDTLVFRNGDVRTVSEIYNEDPVRIYWNESVNGGENNPRYPVTVTTANYVPETKNTARIKPDSSVVSGGQYMDVYVGAPAVIDNKHVHMAGHSADTEVFLGTDNNFISTKEKGSGPARVNLKSENDITVSDTNLRMSRGSTFVSIYGDGSNKNHEGYTGDMTFNTGVADDQGNYYIGGEQCNHADAFISKYGPGGDLIWTKINDYNYAWAGGADSVTLNPANNEVAMAVRTNYGKSNQYYKISVFDSETGDIKATHDVYDDDGSIYTAQLRWHPTLGYVLSGRTYGERTTTSPMAGVGGTGMNIIELPRADAQINGAFPQPWADWYISGDGINGQQNLQAGVGLYQNVPVIATSGIGTGMTVTIRVDYNGNYYENYASYTTGTDYNSGDSFKIPGSYLGGIDSVSYTFNSGANISGGGTSTLHFDMATYPSLDAQILVGYRANGPGISNANVLSVAQVTYPDATVWDVVIDQEAAGLGDFTFDNKGNDIVGTVADNSYINNGFAGTPSATAPIRIDMGPMGYGSDFTGGTFTLSRPLTDRAFVWCESWKKFISPTNNTTNTTSTYDSAIDPNGNIVLGGYDNNSGRGMLWKLDASGNTVWVKGYDIGYIWSVAISKVTGHIYLGTSSGSILKVDNNGNLVKSVFGSGPWGMSNIVVRLDQDLDGQEYLYVGSSFGAMWTGNNGYMVNKLDTDLNLIWTRDLWYDGTMYQHYDHFMPNMIIGRDSVVVLGFTQALNNYPLNAIMASFTKDDYFKTVTMNGWRIENYGGFVAYTNNTNDISSVTDLTTSLGVSTSSLQYNANQDNLSWLKWAWKSTVIDLNTTRKDIVGVGGIGFVDGGVLDHNPSDIPPSPTDFARRGWNYTLQLSDRGRFIINQPVPNVSSAQDLYITVPTNSNVPFNVGTVITLINSSSNTAAGYQIYVQPENYPGSDAPKIWAPTSGNQNPSTWSFQGIQTATLMKIGSNEWLLTCNNPINRD